MATAFADLTPNSLMTIDAPENGAYELDEGELIFVGSAGMKHERIKSRILRILFAWEDRVGTGQIFAETMFTLAPRTARIPDAAMVFNERVASVPNEDIVCPIAPDLAVEIISKIESAFAAERKVQQYLAAGVEEVWQVYPEQQLVRVRRPESSEDFENHEPLRSQVLKGFEVTVNQFFAD